MTIAPQWKGPPPDDTDVFAGRLTPLGIDIYYTGRWCFFDARGRYRATTTLFSKRAIIEMFDGDLQWLCRTFPKTRGDGTVVPDTFDVMDVNHAIIRVCGGRAFVPPRVRTWLLRLDMFRFQPILRWYLAVPGSGVFPSRDRAAKHRDTPAVAPAPSLPPAPPPFVSRELRAYRQAQGIARRRAALHVVAPSE
jgi:hypothetical protein